MKKNIKKKRSLVTTHKARQLSFRTNPVKTGCGRFPNLPPPDDEVRIAIKRTDFKETYKNNHKQEEKMKTLKRYSMAALVILSALVIVMPQLAYAVGTPAGTVIGNRAYVDYQVGGIDQTQIGSSVAGNSSGAGSDTTFTVDKMVDVTVAAGAGATVFANQTSAPLVFTVTNTGNAAMYFALSSAEVTDVNAILTIQPELWLDVDASGTVSAGDVQYVDESTFGTFSGNETFQVLVTGDISAGALNAQTATVNLFANAYSAIGVEAVGGGAAGTGNAIALADDDADGAGADDAANNGADFAVNTYTVSGATLTITKTAAVYSDPVNGTASPVAMPGAVVTYSITVANAAGGANATNVQVADLLDTANLTFATQFNDGVDACAAGEGIVINNVCNDHGDADGSDYNVTTANTVTLSGLTVNAGASTTIKIQVTIN
ncbi:MAG: hypothetical protein OEV42_04035 [Deltaproteobacteria bacterium]|nr:hypothetical protein [Deltaproteobacteria bacterium]